MRSSMLYFCIYVFTLMFFAKPVDMLMTVSPWYAFLLLALWVAISSGIVHVIHFWPSRSNKERIVS